MTFAIDMTTWAWPQWTYAVLIALNIFGAMILDGQPKDSKHSVGVTFVASLIAVFILASGGFFS